MNGQFRVMSPKGWRGPVYEAADADAAAELAEDAGYEVVDVMDDVLVVPDEEPAMPDGEVDQLDYPWNQEPER